jgi:hypothetical protein
MHWIKHVLKRKHDRKVQGCVFFFFVDCSSQHGFYGDSLTTSNRTLFWQKALARLRGKHLNGISEMGRDMALELSYGSPCLGLGWLSPYLL